jgi:filamentous hemagglutinin
MDQMVLDAAKNGAGNPVPIKLGDPRFKGMEKYRYGETSASGKKSVVHYVRDPKTGRTMDFKFKRHSGQ